MRRPLLLLSSRILVPSALVVVLACSSSPSTLDVVAEPIVGGSDATTCAWPAVVLVGGDCTGTLVHPQVVVTAAHCVNGESAPVPKSVTFGEKALNSPTRTVKVSRCAPSPKYNGGDTDDIGYCVLEQAVTDVPVVPVMTACEASALKSGVAIVEVGFGQSAVQTSANDGFGVKRLIAAKIQSLNSNGQINVTTGSQSGEYYGDSGGPIFFQMPDKTWRFIGDDCCSPDIVEGSGSARISTYISVPANLAWLESSSGIDLSICHDGSNWSPSALCSQLPTTPDKASGGWSAMCSSQNQVAPQATCTVTGGTGGSSGTGGGTGTGGGASGASSTGGKGGSGNGGAASAGGKAGSSGGASTTGGAVNTNGGSTNTGGATATNGGKSGSLNGGTAGATNAGATNAGATNAGAASSAGGATGGSAASGGASTTSTGGSSNAAGGNNATSGASSGGSAPGGAKSMGGATGSGGSGDNGGCSCNVTGRSSPVPWHAALGVFALAALRRRRRRSA